MSARVGRYCGALVVESAGAQVLVGNPKEPCPEVPETLAAPFVKALTTRVPLSGCQLIVDGDASALAEVVAARLVIPRNGSVSERLWRLVTNQQSSGEVDARWLLTMPATIWDIVRDTVLKCS
jgi:hypothetical protein